MHYSFHARSFVEHDEAATTFEDINMAMQEHLPDAFLAVFQNRVSDEYVILLGCNDAHMTFLDVVEPIWSHGDMPELDIETCMAFEARHSRMLQEHLQNNPESNLNVIRTEIIDIAADGTTIEEE